MTTTNIGVERGHPPTRPLLSTRVRHALRHPSLFALPAVAVLVVFFIAPYAILGVISFLRHAPSVAYARPFTTENYWNLVRDSFTWHAIWVTMRIACIVTLVTAVAAFPIAASLARARGARKSLLLALVVAPLLIGVVIRSYAWNLILASNGVVNEIVKLMGLPVQSLDYNTIGVTIGLVYVLFPYMVLTLTTSLQNIDPDLLLAARSLGASPVRTFWKVVWPLCLPGLVSGTLLVFALAMSAYATPAIMGGSSVVVVPILIVQQATTLFNWPAAAALALLYFGVLILIVWLYMRLFRNRVALAVEG